MMVCSDICYTGMTRAREGVQGYFQRLVRESAQASKWIGYYVAKFDEQKWLC